MKKSKCPIMMFMGGFALCAIVAFYFHYFASEVIAFESMKIGNELSRETVNLITKQKYEDALRLHESLLCAYLVIPEELQHAGERNNTIAYFKSKYGAVEIKCANP